MYTVKLNNELRSMAREKLRGNWGSAILACFLMMAVLMIINFVPKIGMIAIYVISGPMTLGLTLYFIKLVRGEAPKVEVIFHGFQNFIKALGLYLLMIIFILLWSLLLIIPGIIMSFAYSQVFFILADNTDIKAMDAIRTSKAMMDGYKMKYFLLSLSFIGWGLLCVLTLGIGYLWLFPYMQTSFTYFYEDVKASYLSKTV